MILLGLGCAPEPLPPCPEVVTEWWEPEIEAESRLDLATASWASSDGAAWTLDEGGVLEATTAGTISTWATAERARTYRLRARVEGGGFELRFHATNGESRVLASGTDIDADFDLPSPGYRLEGVVLAEAGTRVEELSISGETWSGVTATGEGTLRLGFLVHVEEGGLQGDPVQWSLRARLVEALAEVFSAHGAVLSVQPDITLVYGGENFQPGWAADLDVSWSAHLHDEDGGNQATEAAAREARQGFAEVGMDVTDINGGFDSGPWARFAAAGYRSLSAYKDPSTQLGTPAGSVLPWRPPSNGVQGEEFQVDDASTELLYLPGMLGREPDHARWGAWAERALSQALAHTRDGQVNTWYFVLHVAGFGPEADEEALDAYLDGEGLQGDLEFYRDFLSNVTDPLVESGRVVYDSPEGMCAAWWGGREGCSG